MMTVTEVSKLAGVSVRTLRYYHKIGLLEPSQRTEAGYRLYDDTALERLQQILLFRELEFPLKEIKEILDGKDFDRNRALEQQVELLTLKKEHLENLITFARGIYLTGVKNMDFSAFDTRKMDEYSRQAKERWGTTEAYRQYEEKSRGWGPGEEQVLEKEVWDLFTEFGRLMRQGVLPREEQAQRQVERLREYFTEHFYDCTRELLAGLGKMYGGGGAFTEGINQAAGEGCAQYVAEAIAHYCS